MADQSELHLQDISNKIQQMVDLLRENNRQTGQQSVSNVLNSREPGMGPAAMMSDPSGPPDFVEMRLI